MFPFIWIPIGISVTNALLAATRSRKYRLFSANVEAKLSTPSARRVKKDSEPSQGSPLRYLAGLIAPESAETRAHPNTKEDVWELSIWDPLPINVRLFCLFSPLHVLVYIMNFPLAPLDPRPSVTLFTTMLIQTLLTVQLWLTASRFEQQAKDHAIVQKEVFNEYDTKFVQPRVHPTVRDVGTQYTQLKGHKPLETWQVGTPTTLVRQSIHSRQQASLATPEGPTPIRNYVTDQQMSTPSNPPKQADVQHSANYSRPSASRKSLPPGYVSSTTSTGGGLPASSTTGNVNFGGNMGIHSHHNSPLKKAQSMHSVNGGVQQSPRNSREMAAYEQNGFQYRRQSSPVRHTPVKPSNEANAVPGHQRPNPFAQVNRQRSSHERYPKMW